MSSWKELKWYVQCKIRLIGKQGFNSWLVFCKSVLNNLALFHTYWHNNWKAVQTDSLKVGLLSSSSPIIWPPPDPFSILILQRDWLRRPDNKATTSGKAEHITQRSPSSPASPHPSPSSYFSVCLSLLSLQLWLVNICRGSNLYLRGGKYHRVE